jgi:arylsulfatase A-like enzyme
MFTVHSENLFRSLYPIRNPVFIQIQRSQLIMALEVFMKFRPSVVGSLAMLTAAVFGVAVLQGRQNVSAQSSSHQPRNVIIFVADGLRHGSVDAYNAPTLEFIRNNGVHFTNSHSQFPTFTTANASAIATGHQLGDTGDFSNTLFSGYPIFNTGNFGQAPGTVTPFVENDRILGDLDDHFNGNYLNEESIMALARTHGYNTASVGKVGPVAIQDVTQLQPVSQQFQTPNTVFVDDSTGSAVGIPVAAEIQGALTELGLPTVTPNRSNGCGASDQCNNGFSGNNTTPGTTKPNVVQQQFFADALTKAILPGFAKTNSPFFVLFWSRDPDGSQHNQGDSLNSLTPGINGPTSQAAVHNADQNLRQLLDYVLSNPQLKNNTDIIITSDHGFSTISRHDLDGSGTKFVNDYASRFKYLDNTGRQEVNTGFLPNGFVAIDIAKFLNLPLYDPDTQITTNGAAYYKPVDPTIPQPTASVSQRPSAGDGVIGGTGKVSNEPDGEVIVAANGGSDLIYVPSKDASVVRRLVAFLARQDYTGGIFVDDQYGDIPGSLPLCNIGFVGDSPLPRPTIVLNFRSFALDRLDRVNSRIEMADTTLQEGQGMHGNLSRADTFNNMAAWGPDFKKGYLDSLPMGNTDIAPTLAKVLGFDLPANGKLTGRVLSEALHGSMATDTPQSGKYISAPTVDGKSTVLLWQKINGNSYYDEACLVNEDTARNRRNPCR